MISLGDYIKNSLIDESRGIYDGCEDLAKYICELIKDGSKTLYIIEGNKLDFENIKFKHLLIYVEIVKNSNKEKLPNFVYHGKSIRDSTIVRHFYNELFRWDEEHEIFNYVEISVKIGPDKTIDYTDITHELNHVYEDWNFRKKSHDEKTFLDYVDKKYDIAREFASQGQYTQRIIGYIEYISTGTETRAFVSQAMSKLKANIDKYSTFDEALKWQYENNEIFSQFVQFKEAYEDLKNNVIKRRQLVNVYKRINKDSQEYEEQIIKKLDRKLDKYHKALTKHINSIIANHGKGDV